MAAKQVLFAIFSFFITFVTCTTTPITVGGLFNVYDVNGVIDIAQLQHVNAFIMAIDEINNNPAILPNYTVNYVIRSSHNMGEAIDSIQTFKDNNVVGIVNGLFGELSLQINAVTNTRQLPTYNVQLDLESGFSSEEFYSFHLNPRPSDESELLVKTFCFLGISRLQVFATQEDKYLRMLEAVKVSSQQQCNIKIVSSYTFSVTEDDYVSAIENAKEYSVTTIILLMDEDSAVRFIKQAYDLRLIRQGVSMLGSSNLQKASLVAALDQPQNQIKGFGGVADFPLYTLVSTPTGIQFVSNYFGRPSTIATCGSYQDSTGYQFLYRNGLSSSGSCAGLDFSLYTAATANPNLVYAYDAAYALANAMDTVDRLGKALTGPNIATSTFITSFTGASGDIAFSSGDSATGVIEAGDRAGGNAFMFNMYIPDLNAFHPVSVVLKTLGFIFCPGFPAGYCKAPVSNTVDNSFPNGYPPYALSTPPSIIRIAGIFNPYDVNNLPIKEQEECLAAFVMAVREVNDKTDGVFDDILPTSSVKHITVLGTDYTSLVTKSADLATDYFGSGVNGLVSALRSDIGLATNQLFTQSHIMQVSAVASEVEQGYGFTYPLTARTSTLDSHSGVVVRHAICDYGYKNVGIFATDDEVGTRSYNEFLLDSNTCDVNILALQTFPDSTRHFDKQISVMKDAGVKIFITILSRETFVPLLEQGYASGLFGEETQIFGGYRITQPSLFSLFQPTTDIATIMKGYIGVSYWPGYALSHTEGGKDFMTRWRQQAATTYHDGGCDESRDDADANFLYRHPVNKTICFGLNYSSYQADGSDLSPYAALTYDATILMLSGYHNVIANNLDYTASSVVNSIRSVSFDGASGPVSISQGSNLASASAISTYGNNVRDSGIYYKIMNFNAEAYSNDPSQGFQQISYFTHEDGVLSCEADMSCAAAVYRSSSNIPTSDTQPNVLVQLDSSLRGFLIAMGVILWIMAIIVTIFLYVYRKSKLLKASQGPVMYFIVLGEFFGGARVMNAALDITDASCTAGIWMGHLAFFFVFGCLFLKTWRVHMLVNSKALKRVKITTKDVLKIMFGIMTAVVIYLFVLTFAGVPHQSYIATTSHNQTTEELRCSFDNAEFHTTLFAIEALILIVGSKLCWATKDVPDAVNEAKFVAMAITSILMISILAFPVVFLLNLPPVNQQLIASLSFAFAGYLTTAIIFGPKMLTLVYYKTDLGANLEMKGKSNQISPELFSGKENPLGGIIQSAVALKALTHEERIELCKKQVAEWEAVLMQQIECDGTDSNGVKRSMPASRVNSLMNSQYPMTNNNSVVDHGVNEPVHSSYPTDLPNV